MDGLESGIGSLQRKGKAASTSRQTRNTQLSTMTLGNPLRKRKSQAGAGQWRPACWHPEEAVEYPVHVYGVDSNSGVLHGNPGTTFCNGPHQRHGTARRSVLARVLKQNRKQSRYSLYVAQQEKVGVLHFYTKVEHGAAHGALPRSGNLTEDLFDANGSKRHGFRSTVAPCQGEKVLYQAGHANGFFMQAAKNGAVLLGIAGAIERNLDLGAHQ